VEVRELVIAGWTGRDEQALAQAHPRARGDRRQASEDHADFLQGCLPTYSLPRTKFKSPVPILAAKSSSFFFREVNCAWPWVRTTRTAKRNHRCIALQAALRQAVSRESWRYERGQAALGAPDAALLDRRQALPGRPGHRHPLPEDLMSRYPLKPGYAMFSCGTLAAKDGIRGGARFTMELEDPVLKRSFS